MEKPFKDETKIDKLVHLTNLLFSCLTNPNFLTLFPLPCLHLFYAHWFPFFLFLSLTLTSRFIFSDYCTAHQSACDKWGLHVLND